MPNSDANLDHSCDLEGWSETCNECRAARTHQNYRQWVAERQPNTPPAEQTNEK